MKTIKISDRDETLEFVVDKIVMWSVVTLVNNDVLTIHTVSTVNSFEYETKEEMYKVAQLLHDAVWGKK